VPVGPAKFDVNRCNESPLRGEKPDFWPVSKSNTGSLPLRGMLPVTTVTMPLIYAIIVSTEKIEKYFGFEQNLRDYTVFQKSPLITRA